MGWISTLEEKVWVVCAKNIGKKRYMLKQVLVFSALFLFKEKKEEKRFDSSDYIVFSGN